MSDADRQRWNARYAQRTPDFSPSADLVALGPLLPPPAGRAALELACGFGGNALWLAERGFAVRAVDVSDVAIAALQAEAERRRSAGRPLALSAEAVDLDAGMLAERAYDLIVGVRFLDRRLFAPAIAALRPGGLLYWETFTLAGRAHHPQMRPEFMLAAGELRRLCAALEILHYAEENGQGRAVCLGRRPGA